MPWEPLPDSVGEPTPIAGPLDAVMSRLVGSGGGGSASATEVIFDRWAELVGAGIAEYSRPSRIEGGCLVVTVTEAPVATELRWQQQAVFKRIEELAGSCPIDQIRVVVR
jgi:predicted nucleic acid-binding Zn ribbon protein